MKGLISLFLKIFFGSSKHCIPSATRRILVMDFGHVGDLVTDFPFLYELKRIFPQAKVDFACGAWGREVMEDNHNVAAVLTASLPQNDRDGYTSWPDILAAANTFKRNHYDLSIDLTGNLSSALVNLLSGSRCKSGRDLGGYGYPYLFASSSKDDYEVINKIKLLRFFDPNVKFSQYDFEPSARITPELTLGRFAVVQPSTPWRPRDWGVERYYEVIKRMIKELDLNILVIGSKAEEARNRQLAGDRIYNMTGQLGWSGTAYLIKQAVLFLGSDSGPAHLAAAVGTRAVVLMGPGEYPRFAPYNPAVPITLIRHEICEQQKNNSCRQEFGQERCSLQNNSCMQSISSEEVFDALKALIKG